MGDARLRKADWFVAPCSISDASRLVVENHYARGASKTAVYLHALFHVGSTVPVGVVWWLPPTRVACESVNKSQWRQVLSLSRMVVLPGVPKNACSFLLAAAVRSIVKDKRFVTLVTWADESQGHEGNVYRSANWTYLGRTGPTPRWTDIFGRQVAAQATKTRTNAQMRELGLIFEGNFYKHKFVLHLPGSVKLMRNSDLF